MEEGLYLNACRHYMNGNMLCYWLKGKAILCVYTIFPQTLTNQDVETCQMYHNKTIAFTYCVELMYHGK